MHKALESIHCTATNIRILAGEIYSSVFQGLSLVTNCWNTWCIHLVQSQARNTKQQILVPFLQGMGIRNRKKGSSPQHQHALSSAVRTKLLPLCSVFWLMERRVEKTNWWEVETDYLLTIFLSVAALCKFCKRRELCWSPRLLKPDHRVTFEESGSQFPRSKWLHTPQNRLKGKYRGLRRVMWTATLLQKQFPLFC